MALLDRTYKRDDGMTAIKPFNAATAKPFWIPKPVQPISHDLPFQGNNSPLFNIQNGLPVFESADPDSNAIKGIVLYDIRPDNWTFIYCHTAKLMGYDRDYGTEFDAIPFAVLYQNIELYTDNILKSCDNALQEMDRDDPAVTELLQTMYDMDERSPKDFTVDIYIPPSTCDLTGERYIRPGGLFQHAFNNPVYDIDFTPSNDLKHYLNDAIEIGLPQQGLKTLLSIEEKAIADFGGTYIEEDSAFFDHGHTQNAPHDRSKPETRPLKDRERRASKDYDRFTTFRNKRFTL